jgi:hypothetical protein
MIGMLDGSIKYYQDSGEHPYWFIYTEKTGSNNPFIHIPTVNNKATKRLLNRNSLIEIVIEFAMILTRH